jgi:hypothetical protein
MFVALGTSDVMTSSPIRPNEWSRPRVYCLRKDLSLDATNTYMLTFGHGQDDLLEAFEKQWEGPILFKSKKAVNSVPGHGEYPRNTLIVFELPMHTELENTE